MKDIQKLVDEMEVLCGYKNGTNIQKCLILGEEIGELFKAVRKREGMRVRKDSKVGTVEEEIADVIIVCFGIANRCGIDVGKEVKRKITINEMRRFEDCGK